MNKPGHIQVDDEILAKYLSGEASPEEAMAVDDWVNEASSNRVLLEQAMSVWAQTAAGTAWQLPDKLQVLKRIRQAGKPAQTATVKMLRWGIAAAVLILLGAAGAYWLLHPTPATITDPLVVRQAHQQLLRDTLPDHSVAEISSGATVKYTKDFAGHTRSVHLTGNAGFDVTADPAKPFVVSVGDIQVKVLGTVFYVTEDPATIAVAVTSGAVSMYRSDSGITVKTGETGYYNNTTRRFHLKMADGSEIKRSFNFTNAPLKDIAAQLEKAYGVRIVFNNKKLETCTMSSSFDNKSMRFIFEVISITLNVQYKIEEDTVFISGNGCN
ncbi:FecR family protein [Chitinophaga sp.]|uniref:FecR family protein n=1 Tax=Chitinophaga sp. TaxID=1869181 RepID=UPI002F9262BD